MLEYIMTKLIVGLGNPEGKYFKTWHNLGFLAIDQLTNDLGTEFKKKGNLLHATYQSPTDTVHLIKPLTYMNLSGQAVLATIRKFKIDPHNMIVLVDDLFIDKGNIRLVKGGSHAGHNGIRSINGLINNAISPLNPNPTPPNYIKIKIGAKPEKPPHCTANYVLERFKDADIPYVQESINKTVEACKQLLTDERFELIQGKFNCRNITDT